MKPFANMTPMEKLEHCKRCIGKAREFIRDTPPYADLLDVWDYWTPYLIERLERLEAVAEAARRAIANTAHPMHCVVGDRLLCSCWQQDVQIALRCLDSARDGEGT